MKNCINFDDTSIKLNDPVGHSDDNFTAFPALTDNKLQKYGKFTSQLFLFDPFLLCFSTFFYLENVTRKCL